MLTVSNPQNTDWKNMPLGDLCEGNATDTYFTLKIYDLLMNQMEDTPVMKLVDRVLMKVLSFYQEVIPIEEVLKEIELKFSQNHV